MEQLHEHNQKTYENICCMYGEVYVPIWLVYPKQSSAEIKEI